MIIFLFFCRVCLVNMSNLFISALPIRCHTRHTMRAYVWYMIQLNGASGITRTASVRFYNNRPIHAPIAQKTTMRNR
uniref:Putative secreted protein n=1 Tax=Anopheles darlingi TaxID=43151 RepID=A0A2M4D1Z3_ANODA